MTPRVPTTIAALLLASTAVAAQQPQSAAPPEAATMIAQALLAAPPSIASKATITDWQGNVLRRGSNAWTCYPNMPGTENSSMCLDDAWRAWIDAYTNKRPFSTDRLGIAYMLAGDPGASNIDPFATGPTPDNQWVVAGPHLMILLPDPKQLEGISTDPHNGGPFVMWKGTPYAHIMVPIADPVK